MTKQEALEWFLDNKTANEEVNNWIIRALTFDELSEHIDKDNLVMFYFDYNWLEKVNWEFIVELFGACTKVLPENKAAILLPYPIDIETADKDILKQWIDYVMGVYNTL